MVMLLLKIHQIMFLTYDGTEIAVRWDVVARTEIFLRKVASTFRDVLSHIPASSPAKAT
jgi:hypothetical protein